MQLPCGVVLKNRIAKSAMSDSLGDGTGHPTDTQIRLYDRWAEGGLAVAIVGEVQGSPYFAEKPGNLVLNGDADLDRFRQLAEAGARNGAQLWLQLGHAGAMAYPPISTPKGPSALDMPGLTCAQMTAEDIAALPAMFARTAMLAQEAGFGGVQVHAAHGFLLSQFLSPLFNKRTDAYGGSIDRRMRLLLEVIVAIRAAVVPGFVVAVKLNATDQLDGGLVEDDALEVIRALEGTGIDLLDISGGTYFPGATSSSDSGGTGPYFLRFAERARPITTKPLMVTGGFKTRDHAIAAVASGVVDLVGLARAFVLQPDFPVKWQRADIALPFPKFTDPPEGGITAWYTMRLTEIGEDRERQEISDLHQTIATYEARDRERAKTWAAYFKMGLCPVT
ncbi:NADH:flavin oxidoreductase/NADH oxidase family protein [Actibacterium sp. 188UL27-1]|nr:NADH:flavin oxidoreductase/NADH oxidase family protein [Actibacterium sp. 188UL27-1]MBM7067377.1 NADH:flavin oxidoreductase/NADH oxidase family protein [Actibacterium sp. 188UL27-1]